MSRLLHRFAKKTRADLVGRILVGGADITVIADSDRSLAASLNGYQLASCGQEEIASLISAVASKIYRDKEAGSGLVLYASDWNGRGKEVLSSLMDSLKKSLGQDEVLLKNKRPENSGAPASILPVVEEIGQKQLIKNMQNYLGELEQLPRLTDRVLDRAKILCRRKLIENMWGAEATQKAIDSIGKGLPDLEENSFCIGRQAKLSSMSLNRIAYRMENGVAGYDEKRYLRDLLIPDVVNNFRDLLSQLTEIVGGLDSLRNIDAVFLENTGNPASWFLPTNVMQDLNETYSKLVEFLTRLPEIEGGIMIPLEYLMLQED